MTIDQCQAFANSHRTLSNTVEPPQHFHPMPFKLTFRSAKSNGSFILLMAARAAQNRSNSDWMIYSAARGGHEHLCLLAKEWDATDYNWMLEYAAEGGHEHLCRLAKEWGVTNYNWMPSSAARGGHEHFCRLAKEWGRN